MFLFSLWQIIKITLEYKKGSDFYNSAAETYTREIERPEKEAPPIEVDLEKLQKVNRDVVGWIYMEDTIVNYPLLRGENNFYYLDKTYEKKYLASGSIYLDAANDRELNDRHSIIYGHNMKNNTMFGNLDDFREEAYLEKHPYIYILFSDGSFKQYEIFSFYRANIEDGTYKVPLNEKKEYEAFLELVQRKNQLKDSDLALPKVDATDKVLTLSTCTEDSADTERFVIHAVLIKETE